MGRDKSLESALLEIPQNNVSQTLSQRVDQGASVVPEGFLCTLKFYLCSVPGLISQPFPMLPHVDKGLPQFGFGGSRGNREDMIESTFRHILTESEGNFLPDQESVPHVGHGI